MRCLFPRFVAGLIALTLGLLLSTAALARGYGPHDQQVMNFGQNQQGQFQQAQFLKGPGQGAYCPGCNGITPEQQQALEETFAIHHKAAAALSAKLHAKQGELDALISDSTSQEMDINRTVGEVNELRSALLKEQVAMRLELRKQGLPSGSSGMRGPGGMMQEPGLDAAPFCGSGTTGPVWNPGL